MLCADPTRCRPRRPWRTISRTSAIGRPGAEPAAERDHRSVLHERTRIEARVVEGEVEACRGELLTRSVTAASLRSVSGRHWAVIPPSEVTTEPVMNDASSLARKSATAAMSSGRPEPSDGYFGHRRGDARLEVAARRGCADGSVIGVRHVPGQIALTRTPRGARSTAICRVRATIAPSPRCTPRGLGRRRGPRRIPG